MTSLKISPRKTKPGARHGLSDDAVTLAVSDPDPSVVAVPHVTRNVAELLVSAWIVSAWTPSAGLFCLLLASEPAARLLQVQIQGLEDGLEIVGGDADDLCAQVVCLGQRCLAR